jgi:hypothetical protein
LPFGRLRPEEPTKAAAIDSVPPGPWVDLADWFRPLAPGSHLFRAAFAADSGPGEGRSGDLDFAVSDPGDASP